MIRHERFVEHWKQNAADRREELFDEVYPRTFNPLKAAKRANVRRIVTNPEHIEPQSGVPLGQIRPDGLMLTPSEEAEVQEADYQLSRVATEDDRKIADNMWKSEAELRRVRDRKERPLPPMESVASGHYGAHIEGVADRLLVREAARRAMEETKERDRLQKHVDDKRHAHEYGANVARAVYRNLDNKQVLHDAVRAGKPVRRYDVVGNETVERQVIGLLKGTPQMVYENQKTDHADGPDTFYTVG